MRLKSLIVLGISLAITDYAPCAAKVYDQASMNDTIPDKYFNNREEKLFPTSFNPPLTDNGGQPPFKYPFALSPRNIYANGWARQVSARELSISKKMSGVQMRLIMGGVRELHWHVDSEWAYMIYGEARVTAVDELGRAFVDDVKQGDLWFFPGGVPHSIQGLRNGAFFVLVFDNGMFNPLQTFGLSDWLNHIPRDVLAKNFGVSKSVFNNLPRKSLYIFGAEFPKPLAIERAEAERGTGPMPHSLAFFASKMKPNVTLCGGEVKIIDKNNFPATNTAAAIVRLKPGTIRELHWHPNDDEWQYYIEGKFSA
ncbi:oxalate decarboxylase OxdD-like [Bradysia coprophila]|uniref:oxalate decarboxylase OxdD-like n=1 Tax=Bradysia coprophila TaxID=38358 RepID=UPI00187D7525|nr:oxalate decarboxylase OxdD-like [Bradysia coprophila]